MKVIPEQMSVNIFQLVKELMMIHPENTQHHKAQHISDQGRKQVQPATPYFSGRGIVSYNGNFYPQYHQGDDNSDDPIAECFQPANGDREMLVCHPVEDFLVRR